MASIFKSAHDLGVRAETHNVPLQPVLGQVQRGYEEAQIPGFQYRQIAKKHRRLLNIAIGLLLLALFLFFLFRVNIKFKPSKKKSDSVNA